MLPHRVTGSSQGSDGVSDMADGDDGVDEVWMCESKVVWILGGMGSMGIVVGIVLCLCGRCVG